MSTNRYGVSCSRAEMQPGSNDQVLRNAPQLLAEFERDCLHRYTPCENMDAHAHAHALAEAIAMCHVELILVHPVREGNGRLSRLLADVMAVQAGRGPLDYSHWDANKLVSVALAAQDE